MDYSALIRHWMGWSPEQITEKWTADPARLPALLARRHSALVESVLAAIEHRANAGEIAAVKWLESRSSTDSPSGGHSDLSQHSFKSLRGIIIAATDGDVEAAEWLHSRGLLDVSSREGINRRRVTDGR